MRGIYSAPMKLNRLVILMTFCSNELFKCHKKLQQLRLKAPEMRVAFLCQHIQAAKDRNNVKTAKDIEQMLWWEIQAKQLKHLRCSTKKNQGVGSTMLKFSSTQMKRMISTSQESEDGIFEHVSVNLSERF